jgi:hypothetical protein
MWRLISTDTFKRQAKWYAKKKSRELKAVSDNLDTFLRSLLDGRKPKPFVYGFLHVEPSDIIAIDQTGAGAKVAATRLYVYADTDTDTLYALTIGDKASQNEDIQFCKRVVREIKSDPNCGGDQDDGTHEGEPGEEPESDEGDR